MSQRPTDLSLTAMALLAAIVSIPDADTQAIRQYVPHKINGDLSWVDELQVLLDCQLVIRVEGDRRYLYRATEEGVTLAMGYMHPRIAERRIGRHDA